MEGMEMGKMEREQRGKGIRKIRKRKRSGNRQDTKEWTRFPCQIFLTAGVKGAATPISRWTTVDSINRR